MRICLLTIGLFISSSYCINIDPAMLEKIKHLQPEFEDRALIFNQHGMSKCTKLRTNNEDGWPSFLKLISNDPQFRNMTETEIKKRFANADPNRIYMCMNHKGANVLVTLPHRKKQ